MALTYRDAGVDIDAGNRLVSRISDIVTSTHRPEVLGGIGGFGGLFQPNLAGYSQPVLVSGTDGVGTKLKLAIESGNVDQIGIDLVAMCVNDILVCGAEPLFFLDYYATAKLDEVIAARVVAGIAEGCKQAGAALIGGETAEMPGMYQGDDFDLAGFCVGIVDRPAILDGSQVKAGDCLLGLPSSGPHSNGYSLIRKILETANLDLGNQFNGKPLLDHLLAPTKIYVEALKPALQAKQIHAMAHITGGGITENVPRVLPDDCAAVVRESAWEVPAIFELLQRSGDIPREEMQRTFNLGIGMILVVDSADAKSVSQSITQASGLDVFELGHIESRQGDNAVVYA